MELTFGTEIKEGYLIKSAYFDGEHHYFKIPERYKDEITDLDDPMVILLVFAMMRRGGDMFIRGRVSKSLLDNLELYISYWHVLMPKYYKPIRLIAGEEVDDRPVELKNKAILCFSGGLDSSFVLYRHKKKLAGRNNRNIERAVFALGSDIVARERERYQKALEASETMCKNIGVDFVAVESNYRHYPHLWEMEHMQFMAAVLRLWKDYPYQMTGSSGWVFSFTYPWATNPVTDRLLSSNNYKLIVDDINFTRMEKVELVKEWAAGLKHLRVCWGGPKVVNNCGVCEKCLRTHLNFKLLGIKNLECMAEPFKWKNFKNVYFDNKAKYYEEMMEYAVNHKDKTDDDCFKELCRRWKQSRRLYKFRLLQRTFTQARCWLLSKITSGKTKKHYTEKSLDYKYYPQRLKLMVFK